MENQVSCPRCGCEATYFWERVDGWLGHPVDYVEYDSTDGNYVEIDITQPSIENHVLTTEMYVSCDNGHEWSYTGDVEYA